MIHCNPLLLTRSLPLAVLTLLFALCAWPFAVFAQTSTATLSGTVVDANNAVVPGATITLTDPTTGLQRTATTNDQGSFTIPLLKPSTYLLHVEHSGFLTAEVRDIVLNVGDERALTIKMKVGNVSETVNVTGEAPLINESPAVGATIDRQFVANMPLNGRSFQALISLTPGVVVTKANASEAGQFSVNGQRADANYFTVDGVSANVGVSAGANPGQPTAGSLPGLSAAGGTNSLVSVDALQEFKIQTSTYAAEFGRSPGGQVQIVTRSGTNQFHGSVFDYLRNDVFDATNWFTNANRQTKPPLRQNDFGGVFSGPLYLPRFGEGTRPFYIGRDRSFFFFSYEGLRLRQPQTAITEVPSLASRQAAPAQIKPYLNAYPVPNGPLTANGAAQFSASFSNPSQLDATSLRIDHVANQKLSIFGRYNDSPSSIVQRGQSTSALSDIGQAEFRTQTLTLGATWAATPSVSNELRANLSKNRGAAFFSIDNFGGAIAPPDLLFFPQGTSRQDSFFNFIPGGVAATLSLGTNVTNYQRQFNLVDNLSVTMGTHQLKFGIDYRKLYPIINPSRYVQSANFAGFAGAVGARSTSVVVASSVSGARVILSTNFSAYVQDTWKATRRLTLTYGLRWEVNPPLSGKDGKNPAVVRGLDDPSTMTLAPFGTPLYRTTYNNFAPRLGVAYQLLQSRGHETMLRGGFGIFYDLGSGQAANAFGNVFPFSAVVILANVTYPLTTAQAQPPALNPNPPFSLLHAFDPALKLPRTYQWNFAFEQSIGSQRTLSASYVGAAGRKLLRLEQQLNPNPSFTDVRVTRNTATSDYHGLQLQFQQRLSRGVQAIASYTWSKSVDTASNDSASTTPGERIDPQVDHGPSDFDVRHNFRAAVTYDIPRVKAGWIGKSLLRDWGLDTNITARSATPVNVVSTRNIGFGNFSLRPDLVPGVPLYIYDPSFAGGRRINKSAFVVPVTPAGQVGRQGTLGRNALRGLSIYQIDLALRRQFNLTERVTLQFRAEAFNLFNHPNFADPIGLLTSGLFGQSTSMLANSLSLGSNGGFNPLYQIGGPRSMQFGLKLGF